MQQYREIKARHRDAILFFRMGDFYEMFYQDAELASRELGLTLTSRNNGGAADVPLAGVPVKAAAEYLRRLVERGHRVAICEQVEDPRFAQGIVRREVIETVTPGAALDDGLLESTRNNFLVALQPGDPVGLAALDVSTGEFFLETVPPGDLLLAVQRLDPREVVLPRGATLPTRRACCARSARGGSSTAPERPQTWRGASGWRAWTAWASSPEIIPRWRLPGHCSSMPVSYDPAACLSSRGLWCCARRRRCRWTR
jgi:DNA mismatch repair ATPase MutS